MAASTLTSGFIKRISAETQQAGGNADRTPPNRVCPVLTHASLVNLTRRRTKVRPKRTWTFSIRGDSTAPIPTTRTCATGWWRCSAAGQVQRRADLGAAARRRRAGRPDLGRRVRADGRHRRLRPVARREVRDLLRAAHPRRHARRAAHDGLGAATGPLQGQQAQRGA